MKTDRYVELYMNGGWMNMCMTVLMHVYARICELIDE